MLHKEIDAKRSQLFLDTCAFDPKYSPEDEAAQRLWSLAEQESIHLVLSHSNQREVDHPNTPSWVKERALSMIFTLELSLTPEEIHLKGRIETIGNISGVSRLTDRPFSDASPAATAQTSPPITRRL